MMFVEFPDEPDNDTCYVGDSNIVEVSTTEFFAETKIHSSLVAFLFCVAFLVDFVIGFVAFHFCCHAFCLLPRDCCLLCASIAFGADGSRLREHSRAVVGWYFVRED